MVRCLISICNRGKEYLQELADRKYICESSMNLIWHRAVVENQQNYNTAKLYVCTNWKNHKKHKRRKLMPGSLYNDKIVQGEPT
jgi:hypothetical protein